MCHNFRHNFSTCSQQCEICSLLRETIWTIEFYPLNHLNSIPEAALRDKFWAFLVLAFCISRERDFSLKMNYETIFRWIGLSNNTPPKPYKLHTLPEPALGASVVRCNWPCNLFHWGSIGRKTNCGKRDIQLGKTTICSNLVILYRAHFNSRMI